MKPTHTHTHARTHTNTHSHTHTHIHTHTHTHTRTKYWLRRSSPLSDGAERVLDEIPTSGKQMQRRLPHDLPPGSRKSGFSYASFVPCQARPSFPSTFGVSISPLFFIPCHIHCFQASLGVVMATCQRELHRFYDAEMLVKSPTHAPSASPSASLSASPTTQPSARKLNERSPGLASWFSDSCAKLCRGELIEPLPEF